jgi:ABC-type multidrug transport system permease subunit
MSMLARQIMQLCLMHLRVWWRTPRQMLTSVMLSCAFLLVGTQLLHVRVSGRVAIGLCAGDQPLLSAIETELTGLGITTVQCDSYVQATSDMQAGRLVAVISLMPRTLRLTLAGANPMLDREIHGILLRVAARVCAAQPQGDQIVMETAHQSVEDINTFMTASLIPFLIMTLATVNCGMHWLRDWERGTVHTIRALPLSRTALPLARTLAGGLLVCGILAVALVVCRMVVPWHLPARPAAWALVLLVQIIHALAFFSMLAAVCKRYLLYVDAAMLLILLMMFTSGTIKPVEAMAAWERMLAHCTPAFYAVRSMRAVMSGTTAVLAGDLLALLLCAAGCYTLTYLLFTRARIAR